MAPSNEFAMIGNESECGQILNTHFVNRLRSGYIRTNGVVMADVYPEYADSIRRFKIRDDDVFVCSYPKSGTTWVQEMVWCIENGLNFGDAYTFLGERFPFLELSAYLSLRKTEENRPEVSTLNFRTDSVKFVDGLKSPRYIKSHLPFNFLPEQLNQFSTNAKIIYVYRNPKDVCISHFHFSQTFEGYTGDFKMFSKLFLNEMLMYSPFWSHVLKFWEQRNNLSVLFLMYEDMKKDLPSAIKKTAKFLGKSLSDEQVNSLADHLSFESMKKNRAVNYETWKDFNKKYYSIENDGAFMRAGSVGQWKKEMSPDIIKEFDSWTKDKTAGTGFQALC